MESDIIQRKLASVQLISKLEDIENADNIEMATVLGWHCVVRKGEFKVGDKVVYLEIDSIPPADNPDFDFLKNSKGKIKPIKTRKIRGVFSQGLVMPLSILHYDGNVDVGTDVTEILGVKKKEDEIIEFYKASGKLFVATEKVDGTSFTAFIRDGKFGICSRNMEVKLDADSPYSAIAKKYHLEEKFMYLRDKLIDFDFAIQGEIIGYNIQKNKYKVKEYECYLFNFFNIDRQKSIGFYGDDAEKEEFDNWTLGSIAHALDMYTVPIVDKNFIMTNDIDKLVEYSIGKSVLNPEQEREGVVFRLKYNREMSHYGERISFKAISPIFLTS